jgi:hypothetical protein
VAELDKCRGETDGFRDVVHGHFALFVLVGVEEACYESVIFSRVSERVSMCMWMCLDLFRFAWESCLVCLTWCVWLERLRRSVLDEMKGKGEDEVREW